MPGDLEHSPKVSLKENKREVSELCKSLPTKCDSGIMSGAHFDSQRLLKRASVAGSVRHGRGITDMSFTCRLDKSLICHISTQHTVKHESFYVSTHFFFYIYKITHACVRHDLHQSFLQEQFLFILTMFKSAISQVVCGHREIRR